MPSTTGSGEQGVMVAQAGELFGGAGAGPMGFESRTAFLLTAAAATTVAVGIGFGIAEIYDDDDDDDVVVPVSP